MFQTLARKLSQCFGCVKFVANVTLVQFLPLLREVMLLNSSKGLHAEGADRSNRTCIIIAAVSKCPKNARSYSSCFLLWTRLQRMG